MDRRIDLTQNGDFLENRSNITRSDNPRNISSDILTRMRIRLHSILNSKYKRRELKIIDGKISMERQLGIETGSCYRCGIKIIGNNTCCEHCELAIESDILKQIHFGL